MIHVPNHDFDFSKVQLTMPVATHTGGFYTKIIYSQAEDSLYVYSPRCRTREGVVSVPSSNKKYVDLVFSNVNGAIVDWTFSLEERLQQLIYDKRSSWFTDDMELDDIQSSFKQAMTAFKGGQFVLRAYVQMGRARFPSLPQVFDSSENPLTLDDVRSDADIITILDFQGIKFTSRSFSIVVAVKQIMVLQKVNTFKQCLIRPTFELAEEEPAKKEQSDPTERGSALKEEGREPQNALDEPAEPPAGPSAEELARAEEAARAKAAAEASYLQAVERAKRLEEEVLATKREVEQLKGTLNSKP
jgi:hypothetical protein